jgi:Recombinase
MLPTFSRIGGPRLNLGRFRRHVHREHGNGSLSSATGGEEGFDDRSWDIEQVLLAFDPSPDRDPQRITKRWDHRHKLCVSRSHTCLDRFHCAAQTAEVRCCSPKCLPSECFESSRGWQVTRATTLIESRGGQIVAEFFDVDRSRSIPPARRPRYLGARPPYGYQLRDAGPHPNPAKAADGKRLHALAIDEPAAAVVQRIFALFLAGAGIFAIAEELTREGIPCPSAHDPGRDKHRCGLAWSKGAVRVILTNPRYAGRQVWNRQRKDGCKDSGSTRPTTTAAGFPAEYALANKIAHPRNVYLREDAFDARVNHWLGRVRARPPASDHRAAHGRPGQQRTRRRSDGGSHGQDR